MQEEAEPEPRSAPKTRPDAMRAAGSATPQASASSPASPVPITPRGALAVVYRSPDSLVPDPRNARTYVQPSPRLSIANKQMELTGRYAAELGLTPASRSRVAAALPVGADRIDRIERVIIRIGGEDADRDL